MRRLYFAMLLGFVMFIQFPAYSQSIWLDPSRESSLSVEFQSPNLENGDYKFPTSASFVTGRFVSSRLIVVGELPFVYAKGPSVVFDRQSGMVSSQTTSQTAIGNPYIGLEFRNPEAPIYFEIGGRIPVTSDDKSFAQNVGQVTDFERFEAFVPDLWTVDGAFNYYSHTEQNMILRLRAGGSVFLPKGGGDTEAFLNYSAQIGYDGPAFYLLTGISGRYFLTADGGSFDDRSIHQVGGSLGLNLGSMRPGVLVRLPVDQELKDILNYVIGLNVSFDLN